MENILFCSFATVLFVVLFGYTTSTSSASAAATQPASSNLPGEFVWHDLFTHDLEASSLFYKELFGWSFVDASSEYSRVKRILSDNNHIGNIIEIKPLAKNVHESQWLNYMSVEDVDDAVTSIAENHGVIQVPPRELPLQGRVAVCLDSQGAAFAVIATGGDATDRDIDYNRWIGSELWTNDIDDASRFYSKLVGYDLQSMKFGNNEIYQMVIRDGRTRAGVVKIPFSGVQPNWVPYIAVADIFAVADKVSRLGGNLFTEPDRDFSERAAVIIADPSGAVLGIQQAVPTEIGSGAKI